jgi:mRNA interferase RelE/StbE
VTRGDAPRSVQLSPTAVRALDRLPHKIAAAIVEFVTGALPADPYRLSKPLRFE